MADRHYAPRGDVWLFSSAQRHEMASAITAWFAGRTGPEAPRVYALLIGAPLPLAPGDAAAVTQVHMPDAPGEYARALYAALHDADADQAALVVIESPPETAAWDGVRDRLTRAAR
jgi:L-threonylcarbamoyladenylate synthase